MSIGNHDKMMKLVFQKCYLFQANKTLTRAVKERKLPLMALKERAAGFGERDAAVGASRGKDLLAVAPEPEGRKRKRE